MRMSQYSLVVGAVISKYLLKISVGKLPKNRPGADAQLWNPERRNPGRGDKLSLSASISFVSFATLATIWQRTLFVDRSSVAGSDFRTLGELVVIVGNPNVRD
jgi:hypothetical protein